MPATGRTVEVEAERLTGWVERFGSRHGRLTAALGPTGTSAPATPAALTGSPEITIRSAQQIVLTAADGAEARLAVPYGQLPRLPATTGIEALLTAVRHHLDRPRTVGVLLVRRTGWAVGVATGGVLTAARVGGGHVQGRTKAGGWSQQRFARRRAQQAHQVYERAIVAVADVLLPHRRTMDAVLTGGDRPGVATVLADQRLTALTDLVEPRFLAVGEPTRAALDDAVRRLRAVVITLNELA